QQPRRRQPGRHLHDHERGRRPGAKDRRRRHRTHQHPLRRPMRGDRGFTLGEVLVAVSILLIGLAAVVTGFQYASSGIALGNGETTATFLAEQRPEQLKALALKDWTNTLGALVDERGAALMLALMVLLTLTGLVLALLATSGFEPQISRNHSHTVRTRYVAEAGLEYAYAVLATNVDAWNGYLEGASCSQGAVLGAEGSSLPGLASVHGTFTVSVRNDCDAGDAALTGVGLDAAAGACDPAAAGGAARDANCRVIVTSTG